MFQDFEISVPVRELPGVAIAEIDAFKKQHERLNLSGTIEQMNLKWSNEYGESFFRSFPNEKELAKFLATSQDALIPHLQFESYVQRISKLQFEHSDVFVPRKVEGYLILKENIVNYLLSKTKSLLEEEYYIRFNVHFVASDIQQILLYKGHEVDGTPLGRCFLLYEKLNSISAAMSRFKQDFNLRFDLAFQSSIDQAWEELERNARERESHVQDGGSAAATLPRLDRRAEDSEAWKQFAKQNSPGGAIDWDRSFVTLGPLFTIRILLRRELFSVIYDLINRNIEKAITDTDAPRILFDCSKVLNKFADQNRSGGETKILEKVIVLLKQKIAE